MECSPIDSLLANPDVTDILVNGTQPVFLDRGNGIESTEVRWASLEELKRYCLGLISTAGQSWDARFPFCDLSLGDLRIHISFPPVSEEILLSIRTLRRQLTSPNWGSAFSTLQELMARKESLLIAGSTGAGKTTLLSQLMNSIASDQRILTIEDTREIRTQHPHHIPLVSRKSNSDGFGEITMRDLVKQSLRMRPDRIFLGECRGGEILELLQILNTGHRGSMATIHANSPRDALRRMELLCLLHSSGTISSSVIREFIVGGIQWIAFVEKTSTGRKIAQISQICGKEGDTILLRPVIERGQ